MSKKYGLAIGKFAPFHIGHMYFLTECLKKCDELFIILSYDQRFVDKQNPKIQKDLSLKNRFTDLRDFVVCYLSKFNKPVYYDIVVESNIPEYPNGWEPFIQLIKEKLNNFHPNIIFSSEESYTDDYKKYLPECEHIIIDSKRSNFHISGTELRHMMSMVYDLSKCIDNSTSLEYFLEKYDDSAS